jgi:hypothetical protein
MNMRLQQIIHRSAVLSLAAAAWLPLTTQAEVTPPPGFTALFNGKDLSGWYGFNDDPRKIWAMDAEAKAKRRAADLVEFQKHWRVENEELVNDGEGPYATTDKAYSDIELRLEYKTVAQADSGIYLRATPQVQIWDYTKEGGKWNIGADKGSGGLWNNSPGAAGKDPLVLADKPFGQWNALRILQTGDKTTVYLNGKLVVDHATMENYWDRSLPLFPKGPVQLQTHGGEIRWRNVFIRELPATEANAILSEPGFIPIFNGKDLTGWAGPVGEYEVKDGAIMCKPGKGGTIYYNEEYTDFIVRLEFKLPPGGNNGLAIRYPGQGDTAYGGMCEIQVLDDTADMYKDLDPRQFCGSVYGIIPTKRGYLRPVGEWNNYQVTVKGSTIKVELNGVTIVDGDVSKVKEFKDNSAHPGKDRKSGFFGFAGHNDPVQFRNVRLKPL